MAASVELNGSVDEGWGAVADVFRDGFERGLEVGAACCVYMNGRAVVDIWAGLADKRTSRRWEEDTVVVVRSCTKGATAICAHMMIEAGALDLDAPVIRYWPEFGAQDKQDIRVRWILAHEAGLPVVECDLTLQEACAWTPVVRALECQRSLWEPGKQYAYHPVTWGFLVGELVRRIAGRSVGAFFADEVATPLDLSAWIGLPEAVESRLAHVVVQPHPASSEDATTAEQETFMHRAESLSGALGDPWSAFDNREARAAEFPSSNLVTDARSLARMYAATVGDINGVRLLGPRTIERISSGVSDATPFAGSGMRPPVAQLNQFSLGFLRLTLLGPRSFGHTGRGGSMGLADPDARVGFGYVMNNMAPGSNDVRARNILAAVADRINGAGIGRST